MTGLVLKVPSLYSFPPPPPSVCPLGPSASTGLVGSLALVPAGLGAHSLRRQRVLWLEPRW